MSLVFAIIVAVISLGLDQLTKYLVTINMDYLQNIPLIDGFLSLYRINNDGAGFSIFSGKTLFLIIITVIALVAILILLIKGTFKSKLTDFGFLLVFSGGVGNLIDRIFKNGEVVDFIKTDFIDFPIFNVADISVCIGAGLIILYFIIEAIKERKAKNNAKD